MNYKGFTYEQAELRFIQGFMTQAEWDDYVRAWSWCAPRFGGEIGRQHSEYFLKHGAKKYYERINEYRAEYGFDPLEVPCTST